MACEKDDFTLPVLLNELGVCRVEEMDNVVLLGGLSKGIIVGLGFGSKEDNRGVVALLYLIKGGKIVNVLGGVVNPL